MPRFRSPAKNQQLEVTFVRHGHPQIGKDELSVEEPLEIRIQERSLAITMRTPGDDFELVRGFLLSEGVIRSKDDIQTIGYCPTAPIDARENIINITLRSGLNLDWDRLSRNVFSSTSCGLCGKASIEACHLNFAPIKTQTSVTFDTLLSLPERLRQHQHQFSKTGDFTQQAYSIRMASLLPFSRMLAVTMPWTKS